MAILKPSQPVEILPETSVRIENVRYLPLSNEFEVTVVEREVESGAEVSKMVAAASRLSRIMEIISPANPENL